MALLHFINSQRRQHYWKCLKESVHTICQTLSEMSNNKYTTLHDVQLHLEIPKNPVDFISIDLIGPFETNTKGNQYTLAVICMLTNYFIYIPIPDNPQT